MQALRRFPLIVVLMGFGALAMFIPALYAGATGQVEIARPFLYGGILFLTLVVLLGLATMNLPAPNSERRQLVALLLTFSALPIMLAVPLAEAVPDTRFSNAYVEMVSSITTTGATLFEPDRLPMPVHLWRATVGWLGGFLIWVTAFAVMAPLTLGGFEVTSVQEAGQGRSTRETSGKAAASTRLTRFALRLAPIYITLTGILWLIMILCGTEPAHGLIFAMSTLSTSGITAGDLPGEAPNGALAEIAIFAFLIFAITRRSFMGGLSPNWRELRRDRELRIAVLFVIVIPLFLFLRHWLGAFEVHSQLDESALTALWGSMFMVLSFLTTTGFESTSWAAAQNWSGLGTPGLLLAGIALFGGGVATTAGGVKLLRVYVLYKHGVREMERLIHPSSINSAGYTGRRLRREGSTIAWIFFMLFALSIALVMSALALSGLGFEEATLLTFAALTTTGPIATIATEVPISYATLPETAKFILCAAMVLGRLETLAILALLNPDFWRN
ncbi:MAG: potassium transporter TrkG [Pseudomonadota bacterium]